jgi:cobalamin biosynthetic protein CobC
LAACDGWLMVDEAFADATPDVSVAHRVGRWERLIVLRSFGKFFGLAGLRLGFVLGPGEVIAMLRAILGDWPLGAGALAAGDAAYRDGAWIEQARRDLARRAGRMDGLLAGHGLKALGQCPHFRLIEDGDAQALFARLAHRKILTRPFDYDLRWLRLGIPAREADWARLEEALRDG